LNEFRVTQNACSAPRMNGVTIGCYFCRECAAAIEAVNWAIRLNPDYAPPYRWLAAALGQLDRIAEAKGSAGEAIAIGLAPSTRSTADACRGIGRKITPTCSKVCARPAGTSERAVSAATVRDQNSQPSRAL